MENAVSNKLIRLKALDIYLDSENPRHDPIIDQQDIIKQLLADEQVVNLAKDIAEVGATSPIELIAVMKSANNHYIALEGNRRVCALKLLNDPEQAPKDKVILFKEIQKNAKNIPEEVNVVIFDNRRDADIWLDRRHLGQQGGIGVKPWDSTQKTRRNAHQEKETRDQNILAHALLDYAKKYNIIGEYPKRVLTTATRYLGNPEFRAEIGIVSERSNSIVKINVLHENFDKFLHRFCLDLIEGKEVTSRSNLPERSMYLQKLKADGYLTNDRVSPRLLSDRDIFFANDSRNNAPTEKQKPNYDQEYLSSPDNTNNNVKPITTNQHNVTKPPSTTHDPDKRPYILPSSFKVATNNPILRRIAQEMKEIAVEDHPLAVALITRAFLESTYLLFVEATTGKYPSGQQTHVVIQKVCDILEKERQLLTKTQINALSSLKKLAANQHSPLSPQTLGGFAHAGAYPDFISLKREFNNIAPIIEYMLPKL